MEKSSNQKESIVDNQEVEIKKKLEKIFNYNPLVPIETCPIRDVLSVASDKWSILIVLFIGGHKVLRFGDLKSLIHGISAKVLTERLRSLEKDGYLTSYYKNFYLNDSVECMLITKYMQTVCLIATEGKR